MPPENRCKIKAVVLAHALAYSHKSKLRYWQHGLPALAI
jgi:hypothetical protein